MNTGSRSPLRFIAYGIIILVGYVVQFTPFMLPINGCYPMPLLIFTLIVAFFEHYFPAAMTGLVCGILTDINMINGNGTHALFYMILALLISTATDTLLQKNILSFMCISTVTFVINSLFELFTKAALGGGAGEIYIKFFLRSAAYSIICSIPLYFLFALVFGWMRKVKPKGIIGPKTNDKNKKNRRISKGY